MRHFVLALVCTGLVLSKALYASALDDAIRSSWKNSLQLQAQENQYHISQGDRLRRFIPVSEPQFQYTASDDGVANVYGVSATAYFPLKTWALMRFDEVAEARQRAELLSKKHDIAVETAQIYLDCAVATASAQLQRKNIDDLETLSSQLKALYESGLTTQAEMIAAQLQIRQARADLAILQQKSAVACLRYQQLFSTANAVTLPDDLDASLISELGTQTADEARAESIYNYSQANADLSGWYQFPDFTLSAAQNNYNYLPGSPSGKSSAQTYSVAFTVPLMFPFKESVEIQRFKNQAQIDQNQAQLQLNRAVTDRKNAATEYQLGHKRLQEIHNKDIPLAEALVESSFNAYKFGKIGFAELVLARKTLLDLRLQDIQLRASLIESRLRCLDACQVE